MPNTHRFVSSIKDICIDTWNALSENAGPFLKYEFLVALEESGSVTSQSGWQPHHLVIESDSGIIAAVPGFIKSHSYGEYVFDHSWANAYHQHGLDYYPKWIAAVPFTPVPGPRLLAKKTVSVGLIEAVIEATETLNELVSSYHWLFVEQPLVAEFKMSGQYLSRFGVQFQWHNYNYESFDDFLAGLTSRKRKDIRKSRKQLASAGVTIIQKKGMEISASDMAHFVLCYQQTYLKRSGHQGYLNEDFFHRIHSTMEENLLLVIAYQEEVPIASALFFHDNTGLYGRYWGALKDINGLHFACCYFEGIDFAIQNKLPLFNPGTQGEHKILRGFEPIFCYSLHKLNEPAFHDAVARFLTQEQDHIVSYFNQAKEVLPYNADFAPKLKTTSTSEPFSDIHNHNEKNL